MSVTDGMTGPTRRTVLTIGAVGAAGVALAACSQAASPGSSGGATTVPESGSAGSGSGGGLAGLASIPVGGSVAAKDAAGRPIIITRTADTSVVAFSAICTHLGCTVAPAGKTLDCPCHGSVYDATTGKVLSGPAPRPLPAVPVKISGSEVVAG